MRYLCGECRARAAEAGICSRCDEPFLDGDREDVRELLADIDGRRSRERDALLRWAGVVGALAIVFGLAFVPAYYEARRHFFALPFFLDQIILAIGLAAGLGALLARFLPYVPKGTLDNKPTE